MDSEFQNVDMLAFSGHKFHAPKGIGALFLRQGVRCRTFLFGGHQEQGRRGGTENVAFIVGMSKAIELAATTHDDDMKRIAIFRDKLEEGLFDRIPNLEINGLGAKRMPNTLNVAIHYAEGEGMIFQLSNKGICVSSGSACSSGSLDTSHVLTAMGVPFTARNGAIRFSLSRYTTEVEIDTVLDEFPKIVDRLR